MLHAAKLADLGDYKLIKTTSNLRVSINLDAPNSSIIPIACCCNKIYCIASLSSSTI